MPGKHLSAADVQLLQAKFGIPDDWAKLLIEYPLAGSELTLGAADDASGVGAEMRIMSDAEMLSEAYDMYPGIAAHAVGYVPFAVCLEGSGDPYFVRLADGVVVRIPHDAVVNDRLDESQIEVVASSVVEVLDRASIV